MCWQFNLKFAASPSPIRPQAPAAGGSFQPESLSLTRAWPGLADSLAGSATAVPELRNVHSQ